jgi:hypothetical protein
MGKDGCNFFVGKWTLCEDMWIHVHGEVYSIQHYVITFGSDLRQVGGLLRVLRQLSCAASDMIGNLLRAHSI